MQAEKPCKSATSNPQVVGSNPTGGAETPANRISFGSDS
jgi:hypothetical protein